MKVRQYFSNTPHLIARYGIYILLSVLVMGPLLLPGFILTTDMVFTPTLRLPDHVDNTYVFYWLLHVLNFVIPADAIQKIVLLTVLLLSGIGAHRLLARLIPQAATAVYAGGILYMLNPFVYDRFMAGQYGVLLGYALVPWFATSLIAFLDKPLWRKAAKVGAWGLAASIVSIHTLGLLVVLTIAGVAFRVKTIEQAKYAALWGGAAVSGWALASSYWLVPTLLGQGRIADSLATFGSSGRQAFATVDLNGLGTLGSVLGLQGFWQDPRSLYILPNDLGGWALVQLAMWAFLIIGFVQAWRRQRPIAAYIICVGVIATFLATGVGSEWLATYVPFFAGYREPQKFAALIALAYAFAAVWGAWWLMRKIGQHKAAAMVTLLFVLYTPTMLWGFAGQLRATHYPADWYAVNEQLNQESGGGKVLFLPWHLYMSYSFAGRIIASPAPPFFDRTTIASDDPELAGALPQTRNHVREMIQDHVLPNGSRGKPIGQDLRNLGFGYVLVAKEYDYERYNFLQKQSDLRLIRDSQTLRLYKL